MRDRVIVDDSQLTAAAREIEMKRKVKLEKIF